MTINLGIITLMAAGLAFIAAVITCLIATNRIK